MTEAWSGWVGHVVNGEFCLQKYLGGSEQSAVFLTEQPGRGLLPAAIKLVPADANAEIWLSRWQRAQELSHPNLIRIFDLGRCEVSGNDVLFLVMEYAEENLSQIVPERPLTAEETSEMLWPALDALAYLHGQELIHSCLKPANIMAVNDQLKLASDGIRGEGEANSIVGQSTVYDAPEKGIAAASPAEDIWSLGMTLAEVVTQRVLTWDQQKQIDPTLPEGLPEPFSDIVRGCLRHDPARRWTLADIAIRLRPDSSPVSSPRATQEPSLAVTAPPPDRVTPAVAAPSTASTSLPATASRPARKLPVLPLTLIAIAIVLFIWRGLTSNERGQKPLKSSDQQQGSTSTQPVQAPQGKPSPTKPQSGARPTTTNPRAQATTTNRLPAESEVVHQVLPDVPQAARDTIQGTVRVGVRVQVDRFGSVTGAAFDSAGPSAYFARLASQASQNWKFAPGSQDSIRIFIVRFEFTNTATKATAVRAP